MTLKTHKFARKPFYVDAVRVSEANIEEVAAWCEGEIATNDEGKHIVVKVYRPLNDRQTQAFIGDWVLFAGTGFKVYTPKAFDKSFEKVKTLTKAQADEAGIRPPHEPRPKNEQPKKPVPTPPKRGPRTIGTPVISKEMAEKINSEAEKALDPGQEMLKAQAPHINKAIETSIGEGVEEKPDVDFRDAGTGRFVTEEYAEKNPDTTVAETEPAKSKEDEEADKLIEEVMSQPLSNDNPPDPIFDEKGKQHQSRG